MFASAEMDLCYMKTNMTARKVSSKVFEQLIIQLFSESYLQLSFQRKERKENHLGNGGLDI